MREVKDVEVRKAEIMEAAKKLFVEKGYLKTTTQDIIDAVNMSRGLLYYHFRSKEDILFSIVEKHVEPLILRAESIAHDNQLTSKEKVVAFIENTMIEEEAAKEEDYTLNEVIQLPENSFMMDKINHKLAYKMTECFTYIIEEGQREGVFHLDYPKEVSAYLMTAYTFVIGDAHFHNNDAEKAVKYFDAFKTMLQQVLGTTDIFES